MRSFSEICPQTDPGSPRITINYEFLIPAPPQFKFIIPQHWQHSRLDTYYCDYELELQTKVPEDYTSFYNHGEGPYWGLAKCLTSVSNVKALSTRRRP